MKHIAFSNNGFLHVSAGSLLVDASFTNVHQGVFEIEEGSTIRLLSSAGTATHVLDPTTTATST